MFDTHGIDIEVSKKYLIRPVESKKDKFANKFFEDFLVFKQE